MSHRKFHFTSRLPLIDPWKGERYEEENSPFAIRSSFSTPSAQLVQLSRRRERSLDPKSKPPTVLDMMFFICFLVM